MKKRMIVTLTANELIFASLLANERNAKKRSTNRRFSTRQDYTIHLYGVISELAFAKLIGIYPDTAFKYGDDGVDFLIHGKSIDIKCRMNERDGDLLINVGSKISDIYVKAYVFPEDIRKVEFQGIATKKMILESQIINLGYGDRHSIGLDRLIPIDRLITRIKTKNESNQIAAAQN